MAFRPKHGPGVALFNVFFRALFINPFWIVPKYDFKFLMGDVATNAIKIAKGQVGNGPGAVRPSAEKKVFLKIAR